MENNTQKDTQIQSYIDTILSTDEIVDKRIFLVRHGESEEETQEGYNINKQKGASSGLTEKGKEQIQKVANYLKKILQDPKNTFTIEHNAKDSTRIRESSGIIQEQLGYNNEHEDAKLDSLPPYNETNQMRAKLAGGELQAQYYEGLKERLKTIYKDDIHYVLLMLHKSSISNMENLFIDQKMEYSTKYQYVHGEVRERDYNQEGKFIDKNERKDILQISKDNREGIVSILEHDRIITQELEDLTGSNDGMVSLKDMGILQAQNFINACFRKHPELYEQYLGSEIEGLRICCLTNLLVNHQGLGNRMSDYINATYLTIKHKLSYNEKVVLLSYRPLSDSIIISLFATRKDLREEEEGELFKAHGEEDFYRDLEKRRINHEKAVEIQQRSLDKRIKEQHEGMILERKLYSTTGQKGTEDIIVGLKKGENYVLPVHVGSGKSIWLSELVKELNKIPDVHVIFLEGNDLTESKFTLNWLQMEQHRKTSNRKHTIMCIDAIDEIKDNETKKLVKDFICKQGKGIIVTSRLSEYNSQSNEGFTTLKMEPVDKFRFISSRIESEERRAILLDRLEKSDLEGEIEGNPLLLNFICMLSNEEWRYEEFGIKNLDEINNKADLYENITKLILYKHQTTKGGDTYTGDINEIKERVTKQMGILSSFAYFLYKNKNQKSRKLEGDLLKYPSLYTLYLHKEAKTLKENFHKFKSEHNIDSITFNQLNILFKKIGDDSYGFIHESFEDFFLARYLADKKEGANEIYHVRSTVAGKNNWDEWKKFRPIVDFYRETLVNNNHMDKLDAFLGDKGLLKNDDAIGYNFYVGLDIINQLKKNDETKGIFEIYERKLQQINKDIPNNKYFFIYHFIKKEQTNERIENQVDKEALFNIFDEILREEEDIDAPDQLKEDLQYWNKRRVKLIYGKIEEALNNKYTKIPQIAESLITIGDKEAIELASKCADIMIKNGKHDEAEWVYKQLAKKDDKKLLALVHNDKVRLSTRELEKSISERTELEHTLEKSLYEDLNEPKNTNEIKTSCSLANRLFEDSRYDEASHIYTLVGEINQEATIECACEYAEHLLARGEYLKVRIFYHGALIMARSKRGLKIAKKCIQHDDRWHALYLYKEIM